MHPYKEDTNKENPYNSAQLCKYLEFRLRGIHQLPRKTSEKSDLLPIHVPLPNTYCNVWNLCSRIRYSAMPHTTVDSMYSCSWDTMTRIPYSTMPHTSVSSLLHSPWIPCFVILFQNWNTLFGVSPQGPLCKYRVLLNTGDVRISASIQGK